MKRFTTLLALTALILALAASVAYAASIQCKSGPGDCNGTRAADTMRGTKGKDRMHGFQRGDEMTGRGGPDKLSGGPGADTITPGWGKDRVFAGRGNDTIDSRDGQADQLVCGKGERDVVEVDETDSVGTTCEIRHVAK
jgi:Ca2+-binding RTX toxin-like protein